MIAGHRLRMKSSVTDSSVFFSTIRTHRKSRHGCLFPVIGQITDDGKARAAMGTVYKGILQTMGLLLPVLQAFRANGDIGCHLRYLVRVGTAGCNGKVRVIRGRIFYLRHPDAMNCSNRRMLFLYTGDKPVALLRSQDSPDANTVIPVIDLSFYPHLTCDTIDKRTKANALH